MGRLNHYFEKAKLKLRSEGFIPVTKELASFLIRRKFFLQFAFEAFEYHFLAKFRNIPATVVQVVKNERIISRRILLYASYDAGSAIGTHVVQQLEAFKKENYEIIFVTTSPSLPANEYEKIRPLVSICVRRLNEGYDFVSYRVGFDLLGARYSSLESLVLMNDSCLGPMFDFGPLLQKMREASNSVYGISISEEIAEHIQSYFYHFGSSVLRSPIAKTFFNRIRILYTKWGIVRYFEMGGSQFLITHGVPLSALIDPRKEEVRSRMEDLGLMEPTREPLASEWVRLKVSPFYKRSTVGNG